MFAKINVLQIFKAHLFTLTGSGRKKVWRKILFGDIILFYLIPVIAGVLLAFFGFVPSKEIVNLGLIALTIFVPLLVNVIFLIHTVLEKLRERKQEPIESERKRVVSVALLQDIFCNISYSILMSLITMLALAGCMTALLSSPLLYGTVYFLVIHLSLTGLMILKRLHVLLETSFADV